MREDGNAGLAGDDGWRPRDQKPCRRSCVPRPSCGTPWLARRRGSAHSPAARRIAFGGGTRRGWPPGRRPARHRRRPRSCCHWRWYCSCCHGWGGHGCWRGCRYYSRLPLSSTACSLTAVAGTAGRRRRQRLRWQGDGRRHQRRHQRPGAEQRVGVERRKRRARGRHAVARRAATAHDGHASANATRAYARAPPIIPPSPRDNKVGAENK